MSVRMLAGLAAALCLSLTPVRSQDVETRRIGDVVLENVPAWDESLRTRMLQYLQVRSARVLDVDDVGSAILITTRFADTDQLHIVHRPRGIRRQITFFDEPVSSALFVPGTDRMDLIFTSDIGGNEYSQIYHLDREQGVHRMLTDGAARNDDPVVSRTGRYLAFCGTARNGRDFDIYLRDLNVAEQNRRLWEVSGAFYPSEFSPDESKLLVVQYISARETHWHILDTSSGEHQQITPTSAAHYYGGGAWGADGNVIYFTSDREGEFRKLYRYRLEDESWTCLTTDIDWDVTEVAVDPASGGVAFVINEDGLSKLIFKPRGEPDAHPVADIPPGVISGLTFATRGRILALNLNAANAPSDVYSVAFPGERVTRWTRSEVGGLNPETFVTPELIRFPTFDTDGDKPRMIPAFYYKAKGDGPHPVVLYVHGGPELQVRPTFSSTIQNWVNELGLSVIAPNVRGSTGYGRSYHQLDNGVKREDSVRDIGALLDWIEQQPELDKTRIGIVGGSYGGYMVLGALTNFPGRIKAGIDVVGITDFVTFLKNTKEYRRDLRRAEYGDERDDELRKVLERISPLRNAGKIEAALFVLHGQNDPRVPISEAQQIVAKLRELGRPVWFFKALNEGHGFAKKPNRDLSAVLYTHFWREHLLK